MLTREALVAYGANVQEGLGRCLNNEAFYLRLVGMLKDDGHVAQLRAALDRKDLKGAFEAAHALKGSLSNLALTPVLTPVMEMTELLREGRDMDYSELMSEVQTQWDRLMDMINS